MILTDSRLENDEQQEQQYKCAGHNKAQHVCEGVEG